MGLTMTEQLFIQQMMAAKALTAPGTLALFNTCVAKTAKMRGSRLRQLEDVHAVEKRMDKINGELAGYGLQFKTIFSPWENETFWGLCNILDDATVHQATVFNKKEIAAFFDLLEVLEDNDGTMALVDAHNNVSHEHGMSVKDAANLVQRLNQQKWLRTMRKPSGGTVMLTFGARALLELPKVRSWVIQRSMEMRNEPELKLASIKVPDDVDEDGELEVEMDEVDVEPPVVTRGPRYSRRVLDDQEDEESTPERAPQTQSVRSRRQRSSRQEIA